MISEVNAKKKYFLPLLIICSDWKEKNPLHLFGNVPRKNAVKEWALIYTSVREKLGLKTTKNGAWTHESRRPMSSIPPKILAK